MADQVKTYQVVVGPNGEVFQPESCWIADVDVYTEKALRADIDRGGHLGDVLSRYGARDLKTDLVVAGQAEQIARVRRVHRARRLWVTDNRGQRTDDTWTICEGCTDKDVIAALDDGEEIEQYEGAPHPCPTIVALDGGPAEHGEAATP